MRRAQAALGTITMAVALLAATPTAQAQQPGYPPPLCNVTFSTQTLSSVAVGSTITFSLTPVCDWTPGTFVTVTVNGVFVDNKVPGPDGTIQVLVEVLSPTLLSIDDPVLVPAQCGPNTIRAVGFSGAARTTVTHEATFQVVCPAAAPTPPRRQVAFTGDHVSVLSASALLLVVWGAHLTVAGRRRRRGRAAA